MHLLFTDPSTSPRTELGRIIFGVLYGLSTVLLYALLGALGLPTFYDKLLQVPILNLFDQADRSRRALRRCCAVRSRGARPIADAASAQPCLHLYLGDRLRRDDRVPRRGRPASGAVGAVLAAGVSRTGTQRLLVAREARGTVLQQGSAWACNELGILVSEGRATSPRSAAASFQQACFLGFSPGCANLGVPTPAPEQAFERLPPARRGLPAAASRRQRPAGGEDARRVVRPAARVGPTAAVSAIANATAAGTDGRVFTP